MIITQNKPIISIAASYWKFSDKKPSKPTSY